MFGRHLFDTNLRYCHSQVVSNKTRNWQYLTKWTKPVAFLVVIVVAYALIKVMLHETIRNENF